MHKIYNITLYKRTMKLEEFKFNFDVEERQFNSFKYLFTFDYELGNCQDLRNKAKDAFFTLDGYISNYVIQEGYGPERTEIGKIGSQRELFGYKYERDDLPSICRLTYWSGYDDKSPSLVFDHQNFQASLVVLRDALLAMPGLEINTMAQADLDKASNLQFYPNIHKYFENV